ncbi:hypothetical protein [Formosa algae]|uniref:Muramoyltetrapeptide carboxypeptidase LdcA involved in peptidoglycan recycling n=1 Tax=Formosa algae TaxID=225843 RepID=A0A9X0YJW9_9FLAO|nr:hypothetical protein [Formosa algae]MBP1840450.1 muramoyltetrapeptide carboxypeptidase LdcA involved in peptidoglycan recycling [Formosa algae]MDQ0336942.1 muramoyltetrapeptide carboxypeptidase LdcA involved in peptidoglycan recycling [Formosa algae]OEI80830.1 hypothetical protein AST99_07195 [Formosa algae]PNW28164.1 hypothetical protein BKP44_09820 [Formosa algae]
MGKKKDKKVKKKELKKAKAVLLNAGVKVSSKCKTKCCDKYLKSEKKRCSKCPCFDLLQKVA